MESAHVFSDFFEPFVELCGEFDDPVSTLLEFLLAPASGEESQECDEVDGSCYRDVGLEGFLDETWIVGECALQGTFRRNVHDDHIWASRVAFPVVSCCERSYVVPHRLRVTLERFGA